ncbi:hypothetical protein ACMFMF_001640 [Clarireedia jacksonii]
MLTNKLTNKPTKKMAHQNYEKAQLLPKTTYKSNIMGIVTIQNILEPLYRHSLKLIEAFQFLCRSKAQNCQFRTNWRAIWCASFSYLTKVVWAISGKHRQHYQNTCRYLTPKYASSYSVFVTKYCLKTPVLSVGFVPDIYPQDIIFFN